MILITVISLSVVSAAEDNSTLAHENDLDLSQANQCNFSEDISSQSPDSEICQDISDTVTPENFHDYFDDEGYMEKTGNLRFVGEFNHITDKVILGSVNIDGHQATFRNMGVQIAGNVTINGLTFIADQYSGNLIYVDSDDVTISNLNVTYHVGDESASVINVYGSNNVNILNNTIDFKTHITTDENEALGINIEDSSDIFIDSNKINCNFPFTYITRFEEMGLNFVNSIRAKSVGNLRITNNRIQVSSNEFTQDLSTIQAMLVSEVTDCLISRNNISIVDTIVPQGNASCIYGCNFAKSTDLVFSYNNFDISATGGRNHEGTAYPIQGATSSVKAFGNNFTSRFNGPNIGFYVASLGGETAEIDLENNYFNITGLATSSDSWALVTGIEIQNGNARIYNNTIYTYNVGSYDENAFCYGISYSQWMYGDRSFDIQDNTIVTEGKYTISTIATKDSETTPVIIKNNRLIAHDSTGNESIQLKGKMPSPIPEDDPIESNVSADMVIQVANVWINEDARVTVTVPNAAGSVTITINGKTYEADLINSVATKILPASDLNIGKNILNVDYNDLSNSTSFSVLDGIITQDNVLDYFNQSNKGKLFDCVPEGTTLDFQGQIKATEIGNFNIYINKAVNIISTTGDAFIDLNTTAGDLFGSNPGYRFTIDKNASNTNMTGITLHNTQFWLTNTDHVTLDGISVIVEGQRVGSGVGVTAIRDNSSYITVKNSNFYTRDNGGSSTLVLSWANYCVIDNNTIRGVGNVGNLFYLNTYNIDVPGGVLVNSYNNVTNNRIYGPSASAAICRAICYMGKGNLFENNFISYSGEGLASADNAEGNLECVFKNNTLTGRASMALSPGGVAYNNTVSGNMILKGNSIVYNNNLATLTIDGDNVLAYGNVITGGVTIKGIINSQIRDSKITGDITFDVNSENVSLINNDIKGTITLKGTKNIIQGNNISSTSSYAVVITNSKVVDNIISFNRIYSADRSGDSAVQDRYKKNQVSDNLPTSSSLLVEDIGDVKVGQSAIVKIHINTDATGVVKVIFRDVESTVEITNGEGTAELSDLSEGTYSVEVRFMGDSNYVAKNVTQTFSVSKNDASLDNLIVAVPDNGNPSFSVELANDAEGNLTVNFNGANYTENISSGKATVTIPNLASGKYSALVIYSGDNKYNSVSRNVNFTVKWDCGLDAAVNNIFAGENAIVEVSINANITSGVVVTLNEDYNVNIVNGKGNVSIPNLSAGNYTVKVKFAGNDEFLASELNKTFKVSKIDVSSDELIMDCNGIAVEFSLTLANAAGNLSVEINTDTFTGEFINGKAVVKPELIPGEYHAIVSYSGDENYNPVSKEFDFTIKFDPNVEVSVENITIGENAIIFVSVNPEITTGVTVMLNGNRTVSLVNGKGNVTVPNLIAGDYTVKVSFDGNAKYSRYETEKTFSVLKINPSEDSISLDGNKFSITLTDGEGNLTAFVNGEFYMSQPLVNGGASIQVTGLAPGNYAVTVVYSGDGKYYSISKNTTLNIPAPHVPVVKLAGSNVDMLYTSGSKYSVKLTIDGSPVSAKTVNFILNGKKMTASTDKNGVASIKIDLPPKSAGYKVSAEYMGVTASNTVKVKSIMSAKNMNVKKSAKTLKIKVTLKKVNGKYFKSKKVTLKFNGKTYTVKTNKKGVATFKISKKVIKKLKKGKKYTYRAAFMKDAVSKKITVK